MYLFVLHITMPRVKVRKYRCWTFDVTRLALRSFLGNVTFPTETRRRVYILLIKTKLNESCKIITEFYTQYSSLLDQKVSHLEGAGCSHEIYQNLNIKNCHQIEWNINISAQKKVDNKYKRQGMDGLT